MALAAIHLQWPVARLRSASLRRLSARPAWRGQSASTLPHDVRRPREALPLAALPAVLPLRAAGARSSLEISSREQKSSEVF
jgi:hypothetical protein